MSSNEHALFLSPVVQVHNGGKSSSHRNSKLMPSHTTFQHLVVVPGATTRTITASSYSSSRSRLIVGQRKLPSALHISPDDADNVLSNRDLIDGTFIAVLLAVMFSYLNGRTPSSSNVKLWPSNNEDRDEDISYNEQRSDSRMGTGTNANANANANAAHPDDTGNDALATSNRNNVFDANDWKDIGRPENYLLYTNKIRNDKQRKELGAKNARLSDSKAFQKENRIVLVALLVLFVPIFSVEFFFALSRQFVCGDYVTQVDDALWLTDADKALSSSNGLTSWAKELCSPHLDFNR